MIEEVENKMISTIRTKLRKGEPFRIDLPDSGVLNIDRPVPFLLIYRFPNNGIDY